MSFKLKEKINDPFVLNNLMKDYLGVNLELINMQWTWKRSIWGHWLFLFFLIKHDERRAHNILSLMLDSKYKSLRLIFSFIGHKWGVVIPKEHDRRSPFFKVLKCYHCWKVKVIFLIKVKWIYIWYFWNGGEHYWACEKNCQLIIVKISIE